MSRLSEPQLEQLKRDHPCDQVAARYVTLHKAGGKLVGPCPVCSADRTSKKAARFEVTPDGWVCAVCQDGGDVIKLVMKAEGIEDFRAAVDRLGGVRDVDPAAAERLEREKKAKAEKRERENNYYRERERETLYEIWKRGREIEGTDVGEYLARRHLVEPPGAWLRILDDCPLYAHGGKDAEIVHRGPCMLAPILRADGKFSGLHMTYIDLSQPGGKAAVPDPEAAGELLPAKKVRGSKAGGHIELVPREHPRALVIGEGIEETSTAWRALALADRDLSSTAFWAAVDLGNLGGKAAETVPHPTGKTAAGRAARVPGPVPDLASAAIAIPASVEDIVILVDGDSDPFLTQCAAARAAARWAKPGRTIRAALSPAGFDLNKLAPDWTRILAILDAAAAPAPPAIAAAAEVPAGKDSARRKPRDRQASSLTNPNQLPSKERVKAIADRAELRSRMGPPGQSGLDTAAPPPAAADPPPEKDASSQMGASPKKPDGRRGAGRAASARRERGEGRLSPDDQSALDVRCAFFPLTDLGNAERMRERFRGRLLWCPAIGWLWWDGKRWSRKGAEGKVKVAEHQTVRSIQDEADALEETGRDKLLGTKPVKGKRKEGEPAETEIWLSDLLRSWGRMSESNSKLVPISKHAAAYLEVQPEELDADPFKINVDNGTLTIAKTDDGSDYVTFSDHSPADLITKLAPVNYDPAAACPRYDAFLEQVQGKSENRRFLHQWKGLSLTGDVSEQRLCVFWGKGKNGKSVFEDSTAHVAGDYGETVPIETFLAEGRGRNAGQATPDLAILPGVRMLRTSEPKRGAKLDEALIKLATGGEPIIARHLNRDYFKYYPQFKLVISGNYRPEIGGSDEGIWRRVILVPWKYTVPAELRDMKLVDKLKAEGPGILNRMLDGLRDWLDHGLMLPEDVDTATKEYRRDSDPLGRFLDACVEPVKGERVQSSLLHELFLAWAKANSATEWSPRGFTMAMKERGYQTDKSSVIYFLDIKTTARVGDFVDQHGKAKRQGYGADGVGPPIDGLPAGDDEPID